MRIWYLNENMYVCMYVKTIKINQITKSNFSWVPSGQMTASSVKTSDTHVVTIRYHVTKPFLLADGGDRRCA